MKKLLATACLALGLLACGPVSDETADTSLDSVEQAICPAECPAGTRFVRYTWVCTGQTTSTCPSGIEKEYALCSGPDGYELGTTTCRSRCGCAVAD